MKWLRRLLQERRCTHAERKMVWTDLVLSRQVCTACGHAQVEPYSGFKELSRHERAIRNRSDASH